MIRLSVSDLDSYLYWRESEQELEEFQKRLWGYQDETDNMRAGMALKKFLTHAQEGEVLNATVDGVQFVFAIEEEIALPTLMEQKGGRVFDTRSGPVNLVGKVDGIAGNTLLGFKLTETFDAERYIDSYAWRSQLAIFNAHRFDYHVFVGKYDTNRDSSLRVTIRDYHRLPVYAYPEMVEDVREVLDGLAEVAIVHGPQRNAA